VIQVHKVISETNIKLMFTTSVVEPEPVELQHFAGAGGKIFSPALAPAPGSQSHFFKKFAKPYTFQKKTRYVKFKIIFMYTFTFRTFL
jgi:hypothetical protein